MANEFENRGRFSLIEATRQMDQHDQTSHIPHMLYNEDGTYSIVTHPKDEICDFCVAAAKGTYVATAKEDIYQNVRQDAQRIIRQDGPVKRVYHFHKELLRQTA